MSSKLGSQRHFTIILSFLKHYFAFFRGRNVHLRLLDIAVVPCAAAHRPCPPRQKDSAAPQLFPPYHHLFVATKLSSSCRRQPKHLELGPSSTPVAATP